MGKKRNEKRTIILGSWAFSIWALACPIGNSNHRWVGDNKSNCARITENGLQYGPRKAFWAINWPKYYVHMAKWDLLTPSPHLISQEPARTDGFVDLCCSLTIQTSRTHKHTPPSVKGVCGFVLEKSAKTWHL